MSRRDNGTVSGDDQIERARRAVSIGEWDRALDLLDASGEAAHSAAGLELRAQAAYGAGDLETCLTAWEDLHARHVDEGDRAEAARAAAMIAMYLMMDTGLMAPVRGWLRRAERLLDGDDDAPAHALVAMTRAYERLMSGDTEGVRTNAAAAIELGTRHGVAPAVVIGRVAAARVRVFDGDVDEGLELLDEVGVLLMSGEVDPLTTGMMYCELICAAQGLALVDRASEWTEVMERWRHGAAFGGINGRCRVHRAEMLRTSGPCDLAEAEALRACEELRPWMRREFGWPLVELGNIRLRKGDLDGAEEAYRAAHDHAWSPQPGLALVRMAQGDLAAAVAMIDEAIAHPFDYPSKERPPFGDLRLAPLLDAQAEIAVAAGDDDTVRRAAAALRSIAERFPSRALGACASLAEARAALVDGDAHVAIDRASEAVAVWTDMGAPFEAARARLVLGEACNRTGNAEGARMEWCAARTAFEEFGAVRWAATVAAVLDAEPADPPAGGRPAPSPRGEPALFRLDGDVRVVGFAGTTVHVRDLTGLRHLARLLTEPGREFHALDLVAVERGTLPNARAADATEVSSTAGTGLPTIDDTARAAYRRRLADVDEDIEEAERMNDPVRLEQAQREREYLIAELTRAVGLGGRRRTVGGDAERARTSVTRSIRYALDRLGEHHPTAAAHLAHCVRTGTYCVYDADPSAAVRWTTD